MTTARSAYTVLTPDVPSFHPSGMSMATDMLPESHPTPTHKLLQTVSKCCGLSRPSVSAFLDDNAGLMLVGASQFFLSAMYVSVKILNSLDKPVPTLELIWIRMVFTYICSIAYMYWRKIPDPLLGPKGLRLLLVLRGFMGFFGLSGMYFSLQHLSLSDAVVLSYLAPTLTGFSGAIFLKESLSLKDVLAGLCSFFGVILISRPRFLFGGLHLIRSVDNIPADQSEIATPEQRMLSIIAALIGVLGATGVYTCLRAIGKRAHTMHSLTFYSLQCILASTIGMIIFKIPPVIPMRVSWIAMLLLIGVFGFISQILLTMGFQRETAARGTLALYTGVVFALAFERTIFHTSPSSFSIAGTAVIIGSAIYTSVTKKRAAREPVAADDALERPLLAPDREGSPEP